MQGWRFLLSRTSRLTECHPLRDALRLSWSSYRVYVKISFMECVHSLGSHEKLIRTAKASYLAYPQLS